MVPIIVDCQFFVRFNFCGFTSAHFIYDQEIIITCIKIQFVLVLIVLAKIISSLLNDQFIKFKGVRN